MELSTSTQADFVRLADIIFMKGLESVPQQARTSGIFREEAIPDHTGNTREYTEIDLEEYAKLKEEGDQATRAKVQQGYSKVGKLRRIALDIGITYEMRHYNKYTEVTARLTNLGKTAANRIDLDLQHRITFGTATSYTDMDGVSQDISLGDDKALFATDHALKGSSKTFRNQVSGNPAFSKSGLETMEKMVIENSMNQFGEKISIPYDIIWSTDNPSTVNTIREVLKSTASTTDSKNEGVVNVYQGKYRHVILSRVATDNLGGADEDKVKYWGLASSMNSQAWLGVNEEPRLLHTPAAGKNNEEFSTEDWNFGVRSGYFIVIPGAKFITLSDGSGS